MRVSSSENSLESTLCARQGSALRMSHPGKDSGVYERHLRVPADFPLLESAVSYANQEFQRAASQQLRDFSITIHMDPRGCQSTKACILDRPLTVNAVGENYHLTLQASSSQQADQAQDQQQEAVQLSLDTALPNLPLLRLVSGHLHLKHLQLEHVSEVDVEILATTKSSNAALVVEEPVSDWQSKSISLHLEHVSITSHSGRGIINRAQLPVEMNDCFIAKLW